ncbi:Zinc finger CCCH domain-containing protein 27 [Apostasia shenzhenica]|uniref:Zinc finger CCCH domain-containing protein 27 n=1 Tax=Apostasia shenzhenica TaxID=1088818 RepID=A0A2I0AML5_9ASPA|nr:Zinc finger CCCH domain-containing protein 27 [Apostasia shenzhenica]
MKFEQNALAEYLASNLKALTEADPKILADYVLALLKNDMPAEELQKLCAERLEVFLGHSSIPFTSKLFQALLDGSLERTDLKLDVITNPKPFQPKSVSVTADMKSLLPKEDNSSTSSDLPSDPEDIENSDDDDDDRNHKHRKRDARPSSFDNDCQEQPIRRPNRKRSNAYDNRQLFLDTGIQSRELNKELNSISDKGIPFKLDKRHFGMPQLVRPPLDLSSRSRLHLPFRADGGSRLDSSSSLGRVPAGRGKGRSGTSWSQHDPRFSSLDSLDFASHIAAQGASHPSLFMGPGLPGAGTSQNASWGAFGFIHGMSSGIIDSLHPLGMHATLGPAMTPLNLGMPRQRCRDFEERGFCLRGDMCPMDHGVNRIVVEDVQEIEVIAAFKELNLLFYLQSLSQFNLPVSIPGSHALGVQAGTAPKPSLTPTSSAFMTSNKTISSKNSKLAANDDALKLNGPISTSGDNKADVYDPDEPLWNSSHPDSSTALLRLSSPNTEDESLWDDNTSARKGMQIPDGKKLMANTGPQATSSSVWGRISSGTKSDTGIALDSNNPTTGYLARDMAELKEDTVSRSSPNEGKLFTSDGFDPKPAMDQPVSITRTDFGRKGGKMLQKASRTLYVNGIPQTSNNKGALLSHFRKFGEVIDIYIPMNSEKAFVQFFNREEAEAALMSPDAVMGNRFIKLFWANRDRISDEGQISGHAKPLQRPKVLAISTQLQPSPVDGGKENLPSTTQKKCNSVAVEALGTESPKNLLMNGSKAVTSATKKLENLELLEELRKKQDLLAQKRDEFRRQLVKFEKQASLKKSEGAFEQAVKRHKAGVGGDSAKDTEPRSANICNSGEGQVAGKSQEKRISGEGINSPSSRAYTSSTQQSFQVIRQASYVQVPYPNKFKLDNRPTSFRIFPPLPDKLKSVATLKDHFSKFGDLASIAFEDSEERSESSSLKEVEECAVCVTYHTRHSAERAYQAGKCWEGCMLKFAWKNASSGCGKDSGVQEVPLNTALCAAGEDDIKTGPVSSGSSSFCAGESTCLPESEVDTGKHEDSGVDTEGRNYTSSLSKSVTESSKSSPTVRLHECENPDVDDMIIDDNKVAGQPGLA